MDYLIIIILIIHSTESYSYSKCPYFGKLNFTCMTYDYCNRNAGLACGDGTCGKSCPVNWLYDDGYCYYISNTIASFDIAERICHQNDGKLVSINTIKKMDYLFNLLKENSINQIWTSAKLKTFLEYEWADDTVLRRFDSFCIDEPNSYYSNETRVVFTIESCFKDENSLLSLNFICEMEINNCTQSICNCRSDHYMDRLSCFPLKTHASSCSHDYECNQNAGLSCIMGTCKCQNNTTWYRKDSICQVCPKGWFHFNKSCYLINFSPSLSYLNSSIFCSNNSAWLLHLNDDYESMKINNILFEYFQNNSYFWIDEITLETDECFNLNSSQAFPTTNLWCSDAALMYNYDKCTFIKYENSNICISYQSCSILSYLICEAAEFVQS